MRSARSLVIIDSIQTLQTDILDSPAGSISQIRECAAEMQRFAKTTATPVILIGHIIKDGSLAGPKILEHMVDTVLTFEGERNYGYRILRSVKNRFGPTSETGHLRDARQWAAGSDQSFGDTDFTARRRRQRGGDCRFHRRPAPDAHRDPGAGQLGGVRYAAALHNGF
ncbi:MAG: hypothetical protein MZV63_27250 [Marinilabiliales bacterium]|nr:hypothetical protein [Marinilabiliales bacterium]